MKHRRIGIVLGSGGARGWCHIGALRALEAIGVKPDMVAGASMGALVGAAYVGGKLSELEDWARALTLRGLFRLTDVRLSGGGVIRGAQITALVQKLGIPDKFEDLPIPFVAVAADLSTGKEVWLRDGSVSAAVRASVAIPGVFAPAQVHGRWLIDGGVINPVPVSVVRAMGADVVIAINPDADRYLVSVAQIDGQKSWWRGFGPAYVPTVMASLDMMTDYVRRSRLAADPPEVLLDLRLGHLGALELHRAGEAIDAGALIVEERAASIRRACGLD